MPDHRYWAFISYSHADARWANRLHRQLEGFPVPRRFVGQPGEQGTFFIRDPSGNALEMKGFADLAALFDGG